MEIQNGLNPSENPYRQTYDLYIPKISDFVKPNHLDIGCGDGGTDKYLSRYLKSINIHAHITGFDIDESKIQQAQENYVNDPNLSFTSDIESLKNEKIDSASSIFAYHEAGSEILNTASQILNSGSFYCVVDYDLKGMGIVEFKKTFNSAGELKEIKEMGLEGPYGAFILHTRLGLKDCQEAGEKFGFKEIKSEKLNEKFFFWVGQKI